MISQSSKERQEKNSRRRPFSSFAISAALREKSQRRTRPSSSFASSRLRVRKDRVETDPPLPLRSWRLCERNLVAANLVGLRLRLARFSTARLRRFPKNLIPSCLSFRPSSALRQQLHSPAMRLLSRLEDERKSGAIWYEISRQSPYLPDGQPPLRTGTVPPRNAHPGTELARVKSCR